VRKREVARLALAGIRTVNGLVALLAPRKMLRRLDVDPDANGPALYFMRMFGIRTVLLGVELFASRGVQREEALRVAPMIHASDTASAFVTLVTRSLPRKAAVLATLISGVNTYLALVARKRDEAESRLGADRA
jgi:hypothetical protein